MWYGSLLQRSKKLVTEEGFLKAKGKKVHTKITSYFILLYCILLSNFFFIKKKKKIPPFSFAQSWTAHCGIVLFAIEIFTSSPLGDKFCYLRLLCVC